MTENNLSDQSIERQEAETRAGIEESIRNIREIMLETIHHQRRHQDRGLRQWFCKEMGAMQEQLAQRDELIAELRKDIQELERRSSASPWTWKRFFSS